MDSDLDHVDEAGEEAPSSPARRWLVAGAALVVVLILGLGIGAFLVRLIDNEPAAVTPAAGSVEVGFAQDMSVHHLQAVTMANWARDHSTDRQVEQLAFDIQSTQTEQIGRMKGWLMLWDQPEQAAGAPMTWMTEPMAGHSGHGQEATGPSNGSLMPGMATTAELTKLRSLQGKDLDVFFLQLMLRHHQGGTAMAQYAQDHSSLPALKALVTSILASQGAEADLITRMLATRGAQPLPPP
ncbi:DUF305 domain-containing protein [Amycolatopsis sp. NPDC049868]|uniref:DUF305 domain-containing protein n=1 Tax=Amycolatopsis sp. NPDC049868 TaxID=3363934 RepID=UPI0037AB973A